MKEQNSKKFYTSIIIGAVFLISFDRATKYLAAAALKGGAGVTLIEGILKLTYLENTGAAFGIFKGMQPLFWVLTIIFLLIACLFYRRVPKTRHYAALNVCVMFLISGAIGNFIDRIGNRYVIDFIYFEIIDFPVFNVADIYVTLSVTAIAALILFYYKEGDFDFLSGGKRRKEKDGSDPL